MKFIIFDFDGTLADTTRGIVKCYNASLEIMGLPAVDPGTIAQTIGLPLRESFRTGMSVPEERLDEATNTYRSIFESVAMPCVDGFEGVLDALSTLSSMGMKMVIASSRGTPSLLLLSNRLGIDRYISEMWGVDKVEHAKPHPEMVLRLMEKFGYEASETLVVGDTVYDLQMGKSAGCKVCAVTYGNHSRELLMTENPDFIVDNLRELPALLG